jgi:hypothetical protein
VWATGVTWVDVLVGDFNGDGLDDIAGRVLENGAVFVAQSDGTKFDTAFWDLWATSAPWLGVRVGDFNNDGLDDLVGGILLTGPVDTNGDGITDTVLTFRDQFVAESNGRARSGALVAPTFGDIDSGFRQKYWHSWNSQVTWVDILTGDFDTDGKTDLIARVNELGTVFVSLNYVPATVRGFGGQKFWQQWATGVTWADVRVGDFDGDGRDDLVARFKEAGAVYISRDFNATLTYKPAGAPGPGVVSSQKFWQLWSTAVNWVDVIADDLDGDGKTDLTARVSANGALFVSSDFDQTRDYLANPVAQAFWGVFTTGGILLDVGSGRV